MNIRIVGESDQNLLAQKLKLKIPKNEALRLEVIRKAFQLNGADDHHAEIFDRYVSLTSRYFKVIK